MIAEQVMLHFAKENIPVLPVHDSFLIQRSLLPYLIEVMKTEFEKQIGVPIETREVKKLFQVNPRKDDTISVESIFQEAKLCSDWTARNSL